MDRCGAGCTPKLGGSDVLLHFSPHEVDDAVRSGSVWGSCLSTESCLLVVILFLLGPMEHGYRFLALFSVILAKSGVFLAFSGHPAQPRKKIWAFFDRFGPPCRLLWRVWSIWGDLNRNCVQKGALICSSLMIPTNLFRFWHF